MTDVGDLPSGEHAKAFVDAPTPAGALTLGFDVVGRALIIAAGMELFARRKRSTFARALGGAAAIEIFVVALTLAQRKSP